MVSGKEAGTQDSILDSAYTVLDIKSIWGIGIVGNEYTPNAW